MARQIPKQHVTRAYIRDVPGASARTQREALANAAHVVEYGEAERDTWLRSIGPNSTGWVYALRLIAVRGGKGQPKPSSDFAAVLSDLMMRAADGAVIVEGISGASTKDPAAWKAAVKQAHDQVSAGRRLSHREARDMGALGGAIKADNSAARRLARLPATHVREIKALWKSPEYTNKFEAAQAVADYCLRSELPQLGAARTLERALGGRAAKRRR